MNMDADDLVRMSRVLRHRLRNYASGIKTSVMLLSRELKDRLALSELEYFPLIARECDNLAELTERLSLLFEEFPAPKESLVATVIEQVMTRFRNLAPTAIVRVDITPDASGLRVASGKYLAVCLEEILTNAHEAAPSGEILLGGVREPDRLVLRVKDQGPGVKALASGRPVYAILHHEIAACGHRAGDCQKVHRGAGRKSAGICHSFRRIGCRDRAADPWRVSRTVYTWRTTNGRTANSACGR